MMAQIKRFFAEEGGQDAVEYSLLLVLIGTVVMIYLTGLGLNISHFLQQIGAKLELVSKTTQD